MQDHDILNNNNIMITFLILILVMMLALLLYPILKRIYTKQKDKSNVPSNNSLTKIPDFDKKKEIELLFESIFYSILHEDDWRIESFFTDQFFFKKGRIDVNVQFSFDRQTNIIKIERIYVDYLSTKYDTNGPFNMDLVEFVYSIYSKKKLSEINDKQESFDRSVKDIYGVLGKSIERGTKLNNLLK